MALEGMAIISTIFRISAVISFRLVRVRLLELVHSGRSPYPQFQSCLLIKIVTVTYLLFLVTWLYPLLKNRANATLEKNLKQAESALPKVRLSPRRSTAEFRPRDDALHEETSVVRIESAKTHLDVTHGYYSHSSRALGNKHPPPPRDPRLGVSPVF